MAILMGCSKAKEIHSWQLISALLLGVCFLFFFLGGEAGHGGVPLKIIGGISLVVSGALCLGTAFMSFFDHNGGAVGKGKPHYLIGIMGLVLCVLWLHFCVHGIALVDNAGPRLESHIVDAKGLLPTEAVASLGALYGSHTLYTLSSCALSRANPDDKDDELSVLGYLKFLVAMPLVVAASPFFFLFGQTDSMRDFVDKIYDLKPAPPITQTNKDDGESKTETTTEKNAVKDENGTLSRTKGEKPQEPKPSTNVTIKPTLSLEGSEPAPPAAEEQKDSERRETQLTQAFAEGLKKLVDAERNTMESVVGDQPDDVTNPLTKRLDDSEQGGNDI